MTYLTLIFPLLIVGIAMYLAPDLSPRDTLFGVRVPAGFRSSKAGRRALWVFRMTVLVGFLLALTVLLFSPIKLGTLVPRLLLTGIAVTAWVVQYRRLKLWAVVPEAQPRQVDLSAHLDRLPAFLWLSAIPFCMLLAAGLYLHDNWSRIPSRFPVHWTAVGVPDRWAEQTVPGVYGQLIFGTLMSAWLVLFALALWHGVRRSKYRESVVQVIIAAEFQIGVVSSLVALTPLWQPRVGVLLTIILIPAAGVVGFAVWKGLRVSALPDSDSGPDQGWFAGVGYFNREDPALAVPRRAGFGYTINFARPMAWVLISIPFAIVYVSRHWLF